MTALPPPQMAVPPNQMYPQGNFAAPSQPPTYAQYNFPPPGEPQSGEFYPEAVPLKDPEFPIDDNSTNAQFIKTRQLSHKCFTRDDFENFICCCLLKVSPYPWNAPLALNINIPLSFHRVLMKNKFRKVDSVLHLCLTPPTPHECVTLPLLRDATWVDIVSHYTKYVLVSETNEAPRFVRGHVLGENSNLKQTIDCLIEVLSSDNSYFLTTSATSLLQKDVDVLVCRFYSICEQLVHSDVAKELLCSNEKGFRKIVNYLSSFISHLFRLHLQRETTGFCGLSSDHLKVLVAGTVVLSQGLSTARCISRLVVYPERDCLRTAERSLTDPMFKSHGFNHDCFSLVRFVVDVTPQVPQIASDMFVELRRFLLKK